MTDDTKRACDNCVETQLCDNCGAEVPVASYERHIAFCNRNIYRCEHCGEAVRVADKAEHSATHAKVVCDCGESVEAIKLERHKAEACAVHSFETCIECSERLPKGSMDVHRTQCIYRHVACEWCAMPLPYIEMADHKEYCGSRTERCVRCDCRPSRSSCRARSTESATIHSSLFFCCHHEHNSCQDFIKIADMDVHMASGCLANPQPAGSAARLANSVSPRASASHALLSPIFSRPIRSTSALFACHTCGHDFGDFDSLQAHTSA